jgi:hypothetical protein
LVAGGPNPFLGPALAALNAVNNNGQGASAVDEVFAQLRL